MLVSWLTSLGIFYSDIALDSEPHRWLPVIARAEDYFVDHGRLDFLRKTAWFHEKYLALQAFMLVWLGLVCWFSSQVRFLGFFNMANYLVSFPRLPMLAGGLGAFPDDSHERIAAWRRTAACEAAVARDVFRGARKTNVSCFQWRARHGKKLHPSSIEVRKMPKTQLAGSSAATAADIEKSIQALNKMAERLWGDGREAEAQALLNALDALNRALDRIRIGQSRRAATLH